MSYNYKTLVKLVSVKADMPYTKADKVIRTALNEILYAVDKNEKVSIRGFGVFYMQLRGRRTIKAVGTEDNYVIPQRRCLSFKAAKRQKKMGSSITPA